MQPPSQQHLSGKSSSIPVPYYMLNTEDYRMKYWRLLFTCYLFFLWNVCPLKLCCRFCSLVHINKLNIIRHEKIWLNPEDPELTSRLPVQPFNFQINSFIKWLLLLHFLKLGCISYYTSCDAVSQFTAMLKYCSLLVEWQHSLPVHKSFKQLCHLFRCQQCQNGTKCKNYLTFIVDLHVPILRHFEITNYQC